MFRFLRRTLVPGLVALLTVGTAFPTAGQSTDANVSAELDAQAERVLRDLADRFRQTDTVQVEAVLEVTTRSGDQSRQMTNRFQFAVERPDHFAMRLIEGQRGGNIIADGEEVLIEVPAYQQHMVRDQPASLDELLNSDLVANLSGGIGTFIGTFMSANPYDRFIQGLDAGRYIGKTTVEGREYHQLRLRKGEETFDMWVAAGDEPIIRRIVPDTSGVQQSGPDGQPISIDVAIAFEDWQFGGDIPDDRFAFEVPKHELVDTEAPGFELEQLGGQTVSLAQHRGEHVVILDFWATWCGPCIQAMPIIESVAERFHDQGVRLYAVNLQEGPQKIHGFLEQHGLDVNVLLDRQGQVGQKYGASSIPMTVIIGKDGKVKSVHVGFSPTLENDLAEELEQILDAEASKS